MGALLVIPPGLYFGGMRVFRIVFPALFFVGLYSLLPHKELRFIFYAIPILNVCAAVFFAFVWQKAYPVLEKKEITKEKLSNNNNGWKIANFFLILILVGTSIASLGLLVISSQNYPGGVALQKLHTYVEKQPFETNQQVHRIHIDVLAAMTGVSRFGEAPELKIAYSKEENLTVFSHFDWLLDERSKVDEFKLIDSISSYKGLNRNWRAVISFSEPLILTEPQVFIHQRQRKVELV